MVTCFLIMTDLSETLGHQLVQGVVESGDLVLLRLILLEDDVASLR